MNLSHLGPLDCPLPNLQIFLACVISGIDLIFHRFYRKVVLTSWDRGMSDYEFLEQGLFSSRIAELFSLHAEMIECLINRSVTDVVDQFKGAKP